MKHKILKIAYLFLLPTLLFISCEEPEPTHETRLTTYPIPTIVFNDVIADTIPVRVEDGFVFSLHLEAEGGLVGASVNGEQIHISPYGQLREDISYTYVMPDIDFVDVSFSVFDQDEQIAETKTVVMKAEGRLPPIFTISDLGGALESYIDEPMHSQNGGNYAAKITSAGDHEIDFYTFRGLFRNTQEKFDISYNLNVAPPTGSETTFSVTKHAAFAPNTVLYFGTAIPDVFIADIDDGKRTYQFDVYYDDTVNPAIVGGLFFDLYIVNFSKYKNDATGIYETYTTEIPTPNAWHTVSFTVKDGGRHTGDVEMNEIDAISLKLSPGINTPNPYYFKNFRIVKL